MGIFSGDTDFFGLDIGTSALRVVQMKGGKTKTLARYGAIEVDPSLVKSDSNADQQKLVAWISAANQPPRRVFVNHGEPESSLALALKLKGVGIMAEVAEPLTNITVL